MTTIENCRIASDTYMKRLCSLFVADNWLWMVLPVALAAVVAVFVDLRYFIATLMALMVIMPLILALLYFYYGFSPEARWSIMEKSAIVDEAGITLTFTDERMKKHVINWDDVRYIIDSNDVVVLMLKGRRYSCLMFPTSVINPDVAQAFRQFASQAH